jgi:hypothetical protein
MARPYTRSQAETSVAARRAVGQDSPGRYSQIVSRRLRAAFSSIRERIPASMPFGHGTAARDGVLSYLRSTVYAIAPARGCRKIDVVRTF